MNEGITASVLLIFLLVSWIPNQSQAAQYHVYVRRPTQMPSNVTQAMEAASVDSVVAANNAGALYLFNSTSKLEVEQEIQAMYGPGTRRSVVSGAGAAQIFISKVLPASKSFTAPSWGLDRVDQRALPLNGNYNPASGNDGTGVTAWVVDTGIDSAHLEFGGRAQNVFASYTPTTDCDGHGTHVSGTIGGATYGIAHNIQLRGIKVLNCAGAGTTYTVAQGLLYVLSHLTGRDVINLSLGYSSRDSTIEAILNDLMAAGVFVAAAAGNENANGCLHFPSAQVGVVSVASSTSWDQRSSFSDFGSCVTLFAPGSSITSARLGGGSAILSGTSMATPHVVGAAAQVMQLQPSLTPAQITAVLVGRATQGAVTDTQGSPNLLLYVVDTGSSPSAAPASQTSTPSPSSAPFVPPPSATRTRAPAASASRTGTKPPKPSRSSTKSSKPTPTPKPSKRPRNSRNIDGGSSDSEELVLCSSLALLVAVVATLLF